MSYTPPSGDAADFQFDGSYTAPGGAGADFTFGADEPPAPTSPIKVWQGNGWTECYLKRWTGTAWVEAPFKYHNGSEWAAA